MSLTSSAVTYTSVYTDSEPGRVFWGADEEVSDGGSPRVIVLGYDGLPMQPDEDEREPMFIQPHDPDYVPEPIYPKYIPLEDEHVFPVEEQPLPPVDSPIAESPGYVTESDPKEDPEEYEDDETEDGQVDYPMDGGDDGDDDDGDSSSDDADDEDEEEEEEHPTPADSAVVVPTVELVSPPEGTEPIIPPPSTDISTTGAMITIRLQASISLPPEAEVKRVLAMPTPSPSPPILLSPPSHYHHPLQGSALLVTAALPSPSLPPLPPSLSIPPPVDRRDDIPESEQPPRKRLYLSTIGSRYGDRREFYARLPRGRGIVFMDLLARRAYGLAGALLMGDRMTLQETVWMVEEEAHASREAWAHSIELSTPDTDTAAEYSHSDTTSDMRREMSDMQTELLALQEQQRRARQPGPEARISDHQDASGDADSHI
ncbi:hypothetical protein Tco_1344277 [Tanacetum coccineum]